MNFSRSKLTQLKLVSTFIKLYSLLLSCNYSCHVGLSDIGEHFWEGFRCSLQEETFKWNSIKHLKLLVYCGNIALRAHVSMSSISFLLVNRISNLLVIIGYNSIFPCLLEWVVWIIRRRCLTFRCFRGSFLCRSWFSGWLWSSINSLSFLYLVILNIL